MEYKRKSVSAESGRPWKGEYCGLYSEGKKKINILTEGQGISKGPLTQSREGAFKLLQI